MNLFDGIILSVTIGLFVSLFKRPSPSSYKNLFPSSKLPTSAHLCSTCHGILPSCPSSCSIWNHFINLSHWRDIRKSIGSTIWIGLKNVTFYVWLSVAVPIDCKIFQHSSIYCVVGVSDVCMGNSVIDFPLEVLLCLECLLFNLICRVLMSRIEDQIDIPYHVIFLFIMLCG